MDKKLLTTLFALTLTACATGSDRGSSQSSWLSSSNNCPAGVTLKVDGKATPVTVPNPFAGLKNPGMEFVNGHFTLGLITKEAGMFELRDLKTTRLQAGTFTGDKFSLTLVDSPYKEGACSNIKYKRDSKFIIEEYNADTGQLKGCLYGKFDCNSQLVEINAAISGMIP
jgi:hypothetical protein